MEPPNTKSFRKSFAMDHAMPSGVKPVCNIFHAFFHVFFGSAIQGQRFCQEHAGHRNFEVSRELIAAVKESNLRRCDEILWLGLALGRGSENFQISMSRCFHCTWYHLISSLV